MLVEWCSVLLQVLAGIPDLWQDWGMKVVKAQAQLLERCCGAGLKEGRIHSALVTTRRAIRNIAKSELKDTAIIEIITALTAKAAAPTAGNAPLLGVIAGVCDRLAAMRSTLCEQASNYYTFYNREIIGSRSIVAPHIADGLHDFFISSVASAESVTSEIIPAFEKALLRAPEVVLNGVLAPFVKSLPHTFDLSIILRDRLLKALLSNIKSTNSAVREGALNAFRAIALRCAEQQVVTGVAEELLKTLKDTKAADQRTSYAELLAALPPSDAMVQKVLPGVIVIAGKEPNEVALGAQLYVIGAHLNFAFSHDQVVDANVTKAFVAGLADKKSTVRRKWAAQCGLIAWNMADEAISETSSLSFFENILEKLNASCDEVLSNPVAAAQSGSVASAYVLYAIGSTRFKNVKSEKINAIIKKANLSNHVLGSDAKPSFLVNHRVYTKLTDEEDIVWLIRALGVAVVELSNEKTSATFGVSWAQAIIYLITSSSVPPSARQAASNMLQSAWKSDPNSVGTYIVDGLWSWLKSLDLEEKDTPATTGRADVSRLHLVLNTLCATAPATARKDHGGTSGRDSSKDKTEMRQLLTSLVVLCRQPLMARVRWLDLCLQSGLDPRTIVLDNPQTFIDEVVKRTSVSFDNQF